MKKILIITSDIFPAGNAGATRQAVIANFFAELGCSVDVIGMGEYTGKSFVDLSLGVRYTSLRKKGNSLISRITGRLFFPYGVKKYLQENIEYDYILIISVPYIVIQLVKRYKKRYGAILIHDSVEWYSSCEYKLGCFSPEYIMKNLNNTKWIDTNFRVIAISRYLQEHFTNKGIKCVRIPFVFDVMNHEVIRKKIPIENTITFIYAGMIGRKDHLVNFLKAVSILSGSEKEQLHIHLFGFSRDYLIHTVGVKESLLIELRQLITIHGRVQREIVEEYLQKADFSLLFRNPNERYAKAGFPTKVVESLMNSTPVFCNLSSDLGLYLEDGKNSFICQNESTEAIQATLKRLFNLTVPERLEMQKEARLTAEKFFDYRVYRADLISIIDNL